jgi:ribosome maturation factor RimP
MEQVGQTMGYEVVFVEWVGTGRHRRLRIFIDHPEGVALNDCTRMSPILSNALDAAEQDPDQPILQKLLATPYVLEVSSPGLDRPLGKLEHFRRFMGSKVTVRTRTAVEVGSNQKTFHGTIESVADDAADGRGTITLRMNDSGALVRIDLGVIKRANLVYEA